MIKIAFVVIFAVLFSSSGFAQTDSRETIWDQIRKKIIKKRLEKTNASGVERGLGGIDARVEVRWIDEPGDWGPGEYGRTIYFGGLKRFYKIHVPPSYEKNQPAPVVLNFHGGGGYPDGARYSSGFDDVSDKNGFIVVYPAGTGKLYDDRLLSWNDGRPDKDGRPYTADDVGFINALLDDLPKFFAVDANRVYACGFSNGAQFSYTLANKLSHRIAALACVAGHRAVEQYFPVPSRPISVMQFSGMQDTLAPYYGGTPPKKAGNVTLDFKFTMKPVKETIESWVVFNGCPSVPSETKRIGKAVMQRYGPGKNGTEVVLWTLEDGGHTYPGGKMFPSEVQSGLGYANTDIFASELMWEFFKRHSLTEKISEQ